jgi:hypothetical protein
MHSQKRYLNKSVENEFLKNEGNAANFRKLMSTVYSESGDIEKGCYCEISHYFSGACSVMLEEFKSGIFISDDPYEALLAYHYSIIKNEKLDVYNYLLNPGNLLELKMNETFDFIFSSFGLSYEKLYSFLPDIIGLLKVGGVLVLEIPSYWFFRDNMSAQETDILDYSMKNDKKWIFSEPVEPLIRENGADLVALKQLDGKRVVNRLELSYISSLQKLHKAHVENNIAVLEVANIPEENMEIGNAVIIIRKNKKTLTKDNLFSV